MQKKINEKRKVDEIFSLWKIGVRSAFYAIRPLPAAKSILAFSVPPPFSTSPAAPPSFLRPPSPSCFWTPFSFSWRASNVGYRNRTKRIIKPFLLAKINFLFFQKYSYKFEI
jgi:hypothetical protein